MRNDDPTAHRRHSSEFELLPQVAEVHGPEGPERIDLPSDWTIHDITALRQVMESAGYHAVAPTQGAMFAFAPRARLVGSAGGSFHVPA